MFRRRLGEERFERLFDKFVTQCKDKGLLKERLKIIDATHIIADVAILNTVNLLREGRERVLRAIEKEKKELAEPFAPYITETLSVGDRVMKNTADFVINRLWNEELGGIERCYIRYAMPARDNGGHGPYSQYMGWVGQYSTDLRDYSMVKKCAEWFMRYSRHRLIAEHVSTKERFDDWVKRAREAGRFYQTGRDVAAKNVVESKEYREKGLVLWVIPLVWGHAEFLNFYHKMEERGLL